MRKPLFSAAFLMICITSYVNCNENKTPVTGAEQIDLYRNIIKNKTIAIVANQTSIVGKLHLVDTLLSIGADIRVIFAPEHGFRNMADAGELIDNGEDPITGLSLTSLYGTHKKPTPEDLKDIDIVIFDIQDVGARFYTYISTLNYVMESCAENNVRCLILDRPNPNGFYFDGNILDTAYSSFVGVNPVPIVHGMTVGEYAGMINGEGWLKNGVKCDLTVIKCLNYDHTTYYELPVRPSPNLPIRHQYTCILLFAFSRAPIFLLEGEPHSRFRFTGRLFFPTKDSASLPGVLQEQRTHLCLGKNVMEPICVMQSGTK